MLLSLKRVLGRIAYLSGAIIVSFLVFLIIVWSSNFSGIWQVVSSSSFDFFEKLNFLWSFIPSITTNYTAFSAFYLLLISVSDRAQRCCVYVLCKAKEEDKKR